MRAAEGAFARMHATTVLSVRRGGKIVMGSDGQVTRGSSVVKTSAVKVRKLGANKQVLAGFAGGVADAFTLFERFEAMLEEAQGNEITAAAKLAKEWRSDRFLRRLEALLAVAGPKASLLISGQGDIIQADDGVLAIGSGSDPARAAALAMLHNTDLQAREIVDKGLRIAAEICIYTNDHITLQEVAPSHDSTGE